MLKQPHTAATKKGKGDSYGPGVRNKTGKPVSSYFIDKTPLSKKQLKTFPKKLG
jgi:hypothetical protein